MTPGTEGSLRLAWPPRPDGARVAEVTVDRPAKLNVLNGAMVDALRDTFVRLAADEALRAVVLRGAGDRAWIGGADVGEMAALEPKTAEAFITGLHEACRAIRHCPVPVVAAIRGYCLGAGLEIAAACDLRVATVDSALGMPEVHVGIPSVIEAALLPRLIGAGWATRLVLTGERIDGRAAERIGLVEEAVERDALDAAVERLLAGVIAAGPRAIRAQKVLLRQWDTLPLDDAIVAGIASFRAAFEAGEPGTMMRAFLDRPRG